MIKVGCCGWAKSQKEYFQHFSIIELQQTFYKLPELKTAKNWREKAPLEFEFTLKASQLITHPPTSPTYKKGGIVIPKDKMDRYGFFRPTEEVFQAFEQTAEIAKVLSSKIIVFQCPASFKPTEENKENLRIFFKTIRRNDFIMVWEPRGDWNEGEIKNLCQELNLSHCVDPFKNKSVYGEILYLRLHGIGGYSYKYTDEQLLTLARLVASERKPVYVMFNNTNMFEDALRFKLLLEKEKETK
ncbi:DUF72 domain-containing protein [bacterium]|nr:DUF72 domain-containing protein [bacterium]